MANLRKPDRCKAPRLVSVREPLDGGFNQPLNTGDPRPTVTTQSVGPEPFRLSIKLPELKCKHLSGKHNYVYNYGE